MIAEIVRAGPKGQFPRRSEYRLSPDVILLLLSDGSARILDLGGNFYSASQTAALMLRETLENGLAKAADQVASIYHIDRARALGDLQTLIRDLEHQGLIAGPQSAPRQPGLAGTVSDHALGLLVNAIHALPLSLKARIWMLLGVSSSAIRFLGWPATLRAFQSCQQRRSKHRRMASASDIPEDVGVTIRFLAASYPVPIECKERALCCWALLRRIGLPAKLVVGVSLFPLESHCWCSLDDRILTDHPDKCERFAPVVTYE